MDGRMGKEGDSLKEKGRKAQRFRVRDRESSRGGDVVSSVRQKLRRVARVAFWPRESHNLVADRGEIGSRRIEVTVGK